MNFFYVDKSINQEIAWSELLKDLNQTTNYNKYCLKNDFYEIFKHIITSLLLGQEVVLLDYDFTPTELEGIVGETDLSSHNLSLDKNESKMLKIESKEELMLKLNNVNSNWKITLFTSGTTGLPKKVSHTFKTISRFVKKNKEGKHINWGFAYNPSHMAGLQVFFQALLNGDSLFRLFGLNKPLILQTISEYSINNISATPTFYRLLLPINSIYSSVKRLTFGGEKFDEKMVSHLKKAFPNAKFNNIYASTEAGSLFVASGNVFSIKSELKNLIKIENNELVIHNSLMGESAQIQSEWYHTNDLVEIINNDPVEFRFVSRKNEMINVGGYKVNPNEVEQVMMGIEGVDQVRVFSKDNSILGKIICCEIVSNNKDLLESEIRLELKTKLQEFKIPRLMMFVEQISTTRTGKIKRH